MNVYQSLGTVNKTVWANKTSVLSIAGDWWYLDQLGCGGASCRMRTPGLP